MKKIFLHFLLLPLSILLASVACQDHYVPPTPPAIQTNNFAFIPSRVSEPVSYPIYLNCEFTNLGIGAADITEYGILYIINSQVPVEESDLEEGAPLPTKVVFSDPVVLGVNRRETADVQDFWSISYRAYAKSATFGTVYGEVKRWHEED